MAVDGDGKLERTCCQAFGDELAVVFGRVVDGPVGTVGVDIVCRVHAKLGLEQRKAVRRDAVMVVILYGLVLVVGGVEHTILEGELAVGLVGELDRLEYETVHDGQVDLVALVRGQLELVVLGRHDRVVLVALVVVGRLAFVNAGHRHA